MIAAVLVTSCTLDIAAPIVPPPDAWDPASNTHADSLDFQELLDRYVQDGIPGVVLFVRTPEGRWNGAAGLAKIETADPMTPTHRHFAASVTKMYTATAVMLLAEDGLIDLDARISQYLPEGVYGRISNASESTVRQLLGHTSGIQDFTAILAYELDTLNDPMGSYPPGRLLSYVHDEPSLFAPGKGCFYSNTNYVLLALLVDHVTEASHADFISERILGPLDLDATYYKNESGYPRPPGLVNSYQDLAGDGRLVNVSDVTVHYTGMYIGNTGLIATSADFAEFIEALLGGQVVSRESLEQMKARPQSERFGLGLQFKDTPYGPGIGHAGGDLGIRSEIRHFPDVEATLVLLMNAGEDGVTGRLFNDLWYEAMKTSLEGLRLDSSERSR
jgi:D-alanyl-D-alanine carboxypeptidase